MDDLAARRPKRFIRPGDMADGSPEPVYCRAPSPTKPGALCGGVVGWPAAGSRLERILARGESLAGKHPTTEYGCRCGRCSRTYVFALARAA
jgi:hypothetical protein